MLRTTNDQRSLRSPLSLIGRSLIGIVKCLTRMLAAKLTISLIILSNVGQMESCPPSEVILPCRCSIRGTEKQIWCSHSNLPQIIDGLKAVGRHVKNSINELVLENNQLPALPGRFFNNLRIVRLMLRYNSIERLSNGWLNELKDHLVEIYIVEPQLRSIPSESLNAMSNLIAVTVQSDNLKHLPDFSGLANLTYLNIESKSLVELQPLYFKYLTNLETIHITGNGNLNHLEAPLFDGLISLQNIDLSNNAINWIHLRALTRLPNAVYLNLAHNQISDLGMVGRIVKDLENLKKLKLDHNIIYMIEEGSFVDLPYLTELHLNNNHITEIHYGAFLRTPLLKTIYLHNNHIKRIHPESFLQASGSGIETMYLYHNEIEEVSAVRSLLEALPALKFLDISNNKLKSIQFGSLHGHGTLEQLYINNNYLTYVDMDSLLAMPALRELRLRNNSLSHKLAKPFWNLPGLKGLDLSMNKFHWIDEFLLIGLPSLRRLDLSENNLSRLNPTAFIWNPMLETLNMSINQLKDIHPITISNLNRLFELDLTSNKLTNFIHGLPQGVERVSLRNNRLTGSSLTNKKALYLPNLRMLDLSYNNVTFLPKHAFHEMSQLRFLNLASNRLHILDETAFSGLLRLELLHLESNELMDIDDRAFLPLANLKILNLHANRIQHIVDGLFSNNSKLEQLNFSHNVLRSVAVNTFAGQISLKMLDLSFNLLNDVSKSLAHLNNIRKIELSYNEISNIERETLSAWPQVVEIRLSNNLLNVIKRNSFRNLSKLQYLDLSSNEITNVEMGAFQNLSDLQELVLADNKLSEFKDHTFEDLPSLLAVHLQYNNLRYISEDSFFNSPSILFLNLSNNLFESIENLSLQSVRNIELLDLSNNNLRIITTMPLQLLNWLVELMVDNNKICKIMGTPFDNMPRLRVLSMQNNRLRKIERRLFRNIRSNIGLIDLSGNPIDCSCDMQWLSAWLDEINSPEPGPKCDDGQFLRSVYFDKSMCSKVFATKPTQLASLPSQLVSGLNGGDNGSQLPLLNDHGDVFRRNPNDSLKDECDAFEAENMNEGISLPNDIEYFYDQYIDVQTNNASYNPALHYTTQKSISSGVQKDSLAPQLITTTSATMAASGFSAIMKPNLNKTILNTKYIKKPQRIPENFLPFTFFGYPIPTLNLGRFFGLNQVSRKLRGESLHSFKNSNLNFKSPPSDMMAAHRMQNYDGYNFIKTTNNLDRNSEYNDHNTKEQEEQVSMSNRSEHATFASTPYYNIQKFQTAFRRPEKTENGGFRPLLTQHVTGGFIPIHDPSKRRGIVEVVTSVSNSENTNIVTEGEKVLNTQKELQEDIRYSYVQQKEKNDTVNSDIRTVTPSIYLSTMNVTSSSINSTSTSTTGPLMTYRNRTMANTVQMNKNISSKTISNPAVGTNKSIKKPTAIVSMSSPTLSSTAKTILLIPPSDELVQHLKKQSHRFTTTSTRDIEYPLTEIGTIQPLFGVQIESLKSNKAEYPIPSTSSQLFTNSSENINRYLPTAEEYQHTTMNTYILYPRGDNQSTVNDKRNANAGTKNLTSIDWYYESFKKHPNTLRISSNSNTKKLPNSSSLSKGRSTCNTPLNYSLFAFILSIMTLLE